MRSTPPPSTLSAAATDAGGGRGEARVILRSARYLARRGVFGLVLLDARLVVRRRVGAIADFVTMGAPVTESVLALVGLEGQMLELRRQPGGALDMPSVAIMTGDGEARRLNLAVFWVEELNRFLLLLSRMQGQADLELQLSREMRARLMAEADATARARELARANRDLDEFASIVSHDLKAPMRAIRYLADDLERALADPRAGDPAATLGRIREQSRRMTDMLTALHQYARAGIKLSVASEVDTRALTETIVRSLPRPAQMRIEIAGDWPRLVTLQSQLDLVLRNLVENAIKHHDRASGRICVSASPGPKALEITVADDGPGIPPQHHAAVFMPFRTLRGSEEEGGGMGLAFVKKTIEAVGGRIELVSDPQGARGTAFRVVWPLVIPEAGAI